jgi:hypothetical protein
LQIFVVCDLSKYGEKSVLYENTSKTGGKFAAGVVDTSGKFAAGVIDTGGAP